MNIERNLLSLGLAATLLASCSQDDSRMGADAAGFGHSLSITSATIGNPVTRVTGDDVAVVLEKGSMGLFRAESAGYTAALNNLSYTYSADAGWQPTAAADTLFLHGDDANVCAYYPHNADAKYSTVTAIPLQSGKYVGSVTVVDPNDICYDIDRALNAYKRSTTFALKHAMAMLEFSITKSLNYPGECKLTGITLRNPELIASSTIDITNGTYATTPTKAAVSYNPAADANGIMIGPATVSAALLVPFTPTAEGVTIVFSVNGTSVETVIENTDIAKFEPGHRYSVNVTMFPTELTVTSVALVPWVEVGVGGDDYVHYPVEETKKLTKPIHIGSYDWAWSNLDYVGGKPVLRDFQAWPSGAMWWPYCKITASPEYDQATAGSNSYSYDTDPCSQLEPIGQWRYPTKHQAELLLGTDQVAVIDNGSVLGYWFGTTEVIDPKKDDGTYLFLPMQYTSVVSEYSLPPNFIGTYWLSDTPGLALTVPYSESNVPAIGEYDTQILNGSVRCVKGAVRTTIKLGDVEWAMGNLRKKDDGAYVIDDHQAVIGKLIGSGTGTWAEAVDPGYHFNWNWLDRSVNENTNHSYDANNDPCGKVAGGSWRTPTQAEFQAAIDAGWVRGDYRINGVTVRGTYLGTTTKPDLALGNGDDYLFLPDGGAGDKSDYYKWYSQYWTSTADVLDNKNAYVFEGNNQMDESPVTPSMKSFQKSFGCSVRCVKSVTN